MSAHHPPADFLTFLQEYYPALPPPSSGYAEFQEMLLRKIASGLNIPARLLEEPTPLDRFWSNHDARLEQIEQSTRRRPA